MGLTRRLEEIWADPLRKAKWMRLIWWMSLAYLAFGYLMIVILLYQQGKLPRLG